jgi:hypothetical protein
VAGAVIFSPSRAREYSSTNGFNVKYGAGAENSAEFSAIEENSAEFSAPVPFMRFQSFPKKEFD